MDTKGVVAQPGWQKGRCPYCNFELGFLENLKRNIKRTCKCKKCGKRIDERFLIW